MFKFFHKNFKKRQKISKALKNLKKKLQKLILMFEKLTFPQNPLIYFKFIAKVKFSPKKLDTSKAKNPQESQ